MVHVRVYLKTIQAKTKPFILSSTIDTNGISGNMPSMNLGSFLFVLPKSLLS